MVRVGYRYIVPYTGNSPTQHRGVIEATPRYPLPYGILVSDRRRLDLRFIGGDFSWRYRNRLTVERMFSVGRIKLKPYARAEVYYNSRFHEFSRTELTVGAGQAA